MKSKPHRPTKAQRARTNELVKQKRDGLDTNETIGHYIVEKFEKGEEPWWYLELRDDQKNMASYIKNIKDYKKL